MIGIFSNDSSIFKRRLTQGLLWTDLDKDLANQYIREEKWVFGVKYRDTLNIIDHGPGNASKQSKGVGFKSQN